jgi:hypothetical protein
MYAPCSLPFQCRVAAPGSRHWNGELRYWRASLENSEAAEYMLPVSGLTHGPSALVAWSRGRPRHASTPSFLTLSPSISSFDIARFYKSGNGRVLESFRGDLACFTRSEK